MPLFQPSPRELSFSVKRNSSVYLWGGQRYISESHKYLPVDDFDYLHEFNSVTGIWIKHHLQGRHPPGLFDGGCAKIDHCLYFYGGFDQSGQRTGSLYRLDLISMTWEEMSPRVNNGSPGAKSGCGMIDYDNKLIVHGGMSANGPTIDIQIFDLVTGEYMLSYS